MIMLVDEIAKNMLMGKQTDLILLDYSKAFDKIAHEKLISKLHFYGIRDKTLSWVKDFLDSPQAVFFFFFFFLLIESNNQTR